MFLRYILRSTFYILVCIQGGVVSPAPCEGDVVMAAYWIARSHVTDPATYRKYTDQVPAIVSRHGGRILARGGRYQIMAGPATFERYVVIEFPTLEQGVTCFQSPEYQQASVFRIAGGVVETVVVEGI